MPADRRRPATSKKTSAAKKRARATAMSDGHKRALANGRTEGRISWQAWTEFGVSPVVLKKAGITPV